MDERDKILRNYASKLMELSLKFDALYEVLLSKNLIDKEMFDCLVKKYLQEGQANKISEELFDMQEK